MTTCAFALFVAGGCGGSEQDADEPSATWKVAIEKFEFPETQRLGTRYRLLLDVRNLDQQRAIPNLTVSFTGLDTKITQPNAANAERPNWIRDRQTPGSLTANRNTYSFGKVEPGQVGQFWIDLTPVRRGRHLLTYRVDGGLYGKAKATLEDGGEAEGQLEVAVDPSIDVESTADEAL